MCQKHHSKENLLRQWQQECKPTETKAKDQFEKKVECFNENWMVVKANQNHQISHMNIKENTEINEYKMNINNEYKRKHRDTWKEQPKRKLNQNNIKRSIKETTRPMFYKRN